MTFGATALGAFVGHRMRHLSESLSESFGVMQGAMLGVVGLILAFGLSLALSRYEDRRAAIVDETNAIGTTYLRAQTLRRAGPKPVAELARHLHRERRSRLRVHARKQGGGGRGGQGGTASAPPLVAGGGALDGAPAASAPRLYVETLNEMIDAQTTRVAALNNQVPDAVMFLEILGAAIALAVLSAYLALVGRGLTGLLLATILVAFLLFVTADLDRPTRGLITVPDTVLHEQLNSMRLPPAYRPDAGQTQ